MWHNSSHLNCFHHNCKKRIIIVSSNELSLCCSKRTRTHLHGTVRWTVPATSANTGGYIYFCSLGAKMHIESLPAYQKKRVGCFRCPKSHHSVFSCLKEITSQNSRYINTLPLLKPRYKIHLTTTGRQSHQQTTNDYSCPGIRASHRCRNGTANTADKKPRPDY